MPSPSSNVPLSGVEALKTARWLILAIGVLQVLIGLFAIGSSFAATLATVTVIGILLLIGGGLQVAMAFTDRRARSFVLHLLAGILQGFVGLLMIERPLVAATGLTLVIAIAFVVTGLFRVAYALTERFPGWVWVVFSGAISTLLGLMIWRGWPESSVWVIGLFVGIELLFSGVSWLMLSLGAQAAVSALGKART